MNDNYKILSRKERKLQDRKDFKEYLDITQKNVLDTKKSGIELIAKDEVFVLVNNTDNYWILNYGRLVNNLRGTFKMHIVLDYAEKLKEKIIAFDKFVEDAFARHKADSEVESNV